MDGCRRKLQWAGRRAHQCELGSELPSRHAVGSMALAVDMVSPATTTYPALVSPMPLTKHHTQAPELCRSWPPTTACRRSAHLKLLR